MIQKAQHNKIQQFTPSLHAEVQMHGICFSLC